MADAPTWDFSIRRLILAVAAVALCLGSAHWRPLPAMMFTIAAVAPILVLRRKPTWLLLFAVPIAVFFGVYSIGEQYCWFYPSIDTVYAPGYTEAAFDAIPIGASTKEVKAAIGEPLYVDASSSPPGEEVWSYTHDGKCRWGDWAWFARRITFKNGQVMNVMKHIFTIDLWSIRRKSCLLRSPNHPGGPPGSSLIDPTHGLADLGQWECAGFGSFGLVPWSCGVVPRMRRMVGQSSGPRRSAHRPIRAPRPPSRQPPDEATR